MLITINDRSSFAITQREYTDEGFLKVPGKVARTGVQEYLARELNLDGDPNRIVRVMRPEEEVFASKSLDTYKSADVTIEHPSEMVDAKTFKKVSKGVAPDAGIKDGDFVKCDLIIKDEEAIKAVESGKVQLSVGYTALYDDKVPANADYEFIQRDIKVNHIALVDNARAGAQARLFDNKPNRKQGMLITLDNGQTVEIADEATALLVKGSMDRVNEKLEKAEDRGDKFEKKADDQEAKADKASEDLEEEKKKSSDEAISARINAVVVAKDSASKIAGKDFTCDSVDILTIKKAALVAARPTVDWDSKGEQYILAAFDIQHEESEDGEESDKVKKDGKDSYKQLSLDAAKQAAKPDSARSKFNDSLSEAWKTNNGEKS